MRAEATAERTLALLTELGRATRGARLYLTGGASAVLVGWRERTVDVDIRLDGDEDRLLRAISALKDRPTSTPLGPDRVPGGLELHDRLQPRQRVGVR